MSNAVDAAERRRTCRVCAAIGRRCRRTPPTATDFFAGGGGSSEGLEQAGCDVWYASNHDGPSLKTHAANHPRTEHRLANLSETDFRTYRRTDILWASPSCVWHARSGGRKPPPVEVELLREDEGSIDRATAFAVTQAAEVHRYPVIITENVPEFMNWGRDKDGNTGVMYRWWIDGLRIQGYTDQILILDACEVGDDPVSQIRKRWYGVFTQPGIEVDLSLEPSQIKPAVEILEPDLGKPVARRLYVSPQIEQITERDVPHLVTYRNHARPKRADQHPLATVTAGGNHHAIATITDEGVFHRLLTEREKARAQGFPDTYVFHGTSDQRRKQIGNAVPVNVAKWLGERASAALGKESPCAA